MIRFRSLLAALLLLIAFVPSAMLQPGSKLGAEQIAGERFDALAPVGHYSRWYDLGAHTGPGIYTLSYEVVDRRTAVTAQVQYSAPDGMEVTRTFERRISFTKGNAPDVPRVRFTAWPFPSVVKVRFSHD
jgi:hypothetical protein